MARSWYGGTPADFAVARGATGQAITGGGGTLGTVALLPEAAVEYDAFDEPGGTQITDLLDALGAPVTSVFSSTDVDSLGAIPAFQGPDGYDQDIWLTADAGATYYRMLVSTETLFGRVTTLEGTIGGFTLDDLVDVDTTGATDQQVIGLDIGTGIWGPQTVASSNTVESVNGLTGEVLLDLITHFSGAPLSRVYLVSLFGDGPGGLWEVRASIPGIALAKGVDWVGPEVEGDPADIAAGDRRTYTV